MATTLDKYKDSVDRFIGNEQRVQEFTNDNKNGYYETNVTPKEQVETLPHFMRRLKNRYLAVIFVGPWKTKTQYSVNDVVKGSDGEFWLVVEPYVSSASIEKDIADKNLIPYGKDIGPIERNTRWPWKITYPVKAGEVLTLNKSYYPGTDSLVLFYESVLCAPLRAGNTGGTYQYEEIEENIGLESYKVKVHFDIQVGDNMDMIIVASNLSKTLEEAEDFAERAEAAKTEATTQAGLSKASADKARVSEYNAKASETNAKTSEDNANTSEGNAKTSELAAKASEVAAKTSQGNAKTSETNAKASEEKAKTSELNAKSSEEKAKASETAAKISEDKAKTSELNAKSSEDKAKVSETAAKTSEDKAKTSEQNAKSSEESALAAAENAIDARDAAQTSAETAETYKSAAAVSEANASLSAKAAKESAQASESSAQNAAASQGIATTQAGIATGKAQEAETSAEQALDSSVAAAESAENAATAATLAAKEEIKNFDASAAGGPYVRKGNAWVELAGNTPIDTAEKVLTQGSGGLKSNLSIKYNSATGALQLLGAKNAVIGSAVLPGFQFLNSAQIVVNPTGQPAGRYLALSFETNSGPETVYVNVGELVDDYTPGNAAISIVNNKVSVNVDAASGLEVGTSGLRFKTGYQAMTKAQVDKLAALPIQVLVDSVNGKKGAVTLTKADLNLGSVDNTSDANKPVSNATKTALDGKAASKHAANHKTGGADALTPADIGALAAGGTAVAATKLATARSIALTGKVTGSVNFDGSGNVSIATNTANAATAHTKLTAVLAASANFTVPSYIVGSNKLKIFMDGQFCRQGVNNTFQYKEVGTAGAASTTVQFYDQLPVNTEVTAISEI